MGLERGRGPDLHLHPTKAHSLPQANREATVEMAVHDRASDLHGALAFLEIPRPIHLPSCHIEYGACRGRHGSTIVLCTMYWQTL